MSALLVIVLLLQVLVAFAFQSHTHRLNPRFNSGKSYLSSSTNVAETLTYDVNAWRAGGDPFDLIMSFLPLPTSSSSACSSGFSTCEQEICEVLPGVVPVDLKGTYFRNGYGKFEIGNDKVMHPFDADGLMCAITIENGKAIFRNRFVRTKGFLGEKRARKILYRGAFGTQRSGGAFANIFDTKIKNVANTNALYWAGRLFALWEVTRTCHNSTQNCHNLTRNCNPRGGCPTAWSRSLFALSGSIPSRVTGQTTQPIFAALC